MKKNNPPAIKIETIDLDEDVPPVKQIPKNKEYKPRIVICPPKAHSTPKEPPKAQPLSKEPIKVQLVPREPPKLQEIPPIVQPVVVQRNVQSPTIVSASSSKPDINQVQKVNPKVISISGPLKAIIKSVPQSNQPKEYVIPLKDFIEDKPKTTTMRRQSAAPMTIIHNTTPDNIMNDEVTSLKDDLPNVDFNSSVKRRASVGTPTAAHQEIKSPTHSNLIRVLPSKEFRCSECLQPFATSRLLKYHEDNGLCDKRPQSTTSRALNSFKCFDCNNSFASYYFLRRHRETCTFSLRVKCSYQYCRFRATNPGDIQIHFNEVHGHKLKCKECDANLPSQAALIAHEVMKHGREDVAKKRALKQRQARAAKRAKADLDFDANTLTACSACNLEIPARDLALHMLLCKKT